MNVSYSEARQFGTCQRQWFFRNHLASWNSKDSVRREAFVLSKLQSLSAWRGALVDDVISTFLIPQLQNGSCGVFEETLGVARSRFLQQRDFALAHRVREPGMRISQHGKSFAAWHDVEYGNSPSPQALEEIWTEIEVSLRHAFGMSDLLNHLARCRIIAQPRLQYQIGDFKIAATPDVLAFARDGAIRIVDWKVNFFGTRSAKDQLALYAGVLNRAAPQYRYPIDPRSLSVSTFVLTEAQLLQGKAFDYSITDDDVDEVIDDLFGAAQAMSLAERGEDKSIASRESYPVTRWVEACTRCSFKSICRGEIAACKIL